MNKKDYKELVKKHTPKEDRTLNAVKAFIYGGLMGVLFESIVRIIKVLSDKPVNEATTIALIIFIIMASFLTSLGIFDKLVTYLKSSLIIPITGFAHSITSAVMDYKNDGFINGIGSNCFKLAGSVLLYGIISAFILVIIGVVINV